MVIPPEVRMMIYHHLLDDGGQKTFAIRNRPRRCAETRAAQIKMLRRSNYHVLERSIMRRSYETTYGLAGASNMHPAILAVNRKIREEASYYLYGRHSFHFGRDLEAIVPFFSDKTAATLQLVREVTLHKSAPSNGMHGETCDWTAICRLLGELPNLSKLRLIMEGGQPRHEWGGPKELSVSDLRFLYTTRHDIIEWARDLAELDKLEQVEIRSCMRPIAEPQTNSTLVYAAFSASIETTLVDFLNMELNIPAVAASGGINDA